eukprot:3530800-Alexandrium_andersonii.AAC.1
MQAQGAALALHVALDLRVGLQALPLSIAASLIPAPLAPEVGAKLEAIQLLDRSVVADLRLGVEHL